MHDKTLAACVMHNPACNMETIARLLSSVEALSVYPQSNINIEH